MFQPDASSDVTPPVITGVSATGSGTSATITFTTDEACVDPGGLRNLGYRVDPVGHRGRPRDSALRTDHRIGFGNHVLLPGDLSRRVRQSATSPAAASSPATYTTDDTVPPVVSAIAVAPTGTTATVTWTTDEAATSRVDYGTSATALTSTASATGLSTTHSVGLSGLASGTTYYYRVTSADAAGKLHDQPGRRECAGDVLRRGHGAAHDHRGRRERVGNNSLGDVDDQRGVDQQGGLRHVGDVTDVVSDRNRVGHRPHGSAHGSHGEYPVLLPGDLGRSGWQLVDVARCGQCRGGLRADHNAVPGHNDGELQHWYEFLHLRHCRRRRRGSARAEHGDRLHRHDHPVSGWTSTATASGGSTTFAGGNATVKGANFYTTPGYSSAKSLEVQATLSQSQSIGWAVQRDVVDEVRHQRQQFEPTHRHRQRRVRPRT